MQHFISEDEERRYAELQQLAADYARRGESELLEAMLKAGMPVNLCDSKGNTLLMLACYNENPETARLLLDYGADVNRPNDRGQTPLGGVAFKGYMEIVALLLDYGADINADNGGGMTPIMYASLFGRSSVVEQLQSRGASLNQRNRIGMSAKFMVWFLKLFRRYVMAESRQPGKTAPLTATAQENV